MRRLIGLLLLAAAIAVLVWEAMGLVQYGEWRLIAFGEIAFRLAPESLNLAQAVTQRYVAPWLWDPVIQTFLLWPAWPILGGLAVLFLAWGRPRRRR
jgi:hypothetical protein